MYKYFGDQMSFQAPAKNTNSMEMDFQHAPMMIQYGFAPWLALPYVAIFYLQLLRDQLSWLPPTDAPPSETPEQALTPAQIKTESMSCEGRGGTSSEAACAGFEPAFLDRDSGCVYRSCFANGTPAPIHLLDGLPAELILAKGPEGRVCAVKPSVIAGFVRAGAFYTREQACAVQH